MLDTYFAEYVNVEGGGLSTIHLYNCCAFLERFSAELRAKEFADILVFLQDPPTQNWTQKDVRMLLSQALVWKSCYADAPSHLVF